MLNRIEIDISKILKLWNDDRKTIFREEKKKKKNIRKSGISEQTRSQYDYPSCAAKYRFQTTTDSVSELVLL